MLLAVTVTALIGAAADEMASCASGWTFPGGRPTHGGTLVAGTVTPPRDAVNESIDTRPLGRGKG